MSYKVGEWVRIIDASKVIMGESYKDGDITQVTALTSDGRPRVRMTLYASDTPILKSEMNYIEKVTPNEARAWVIQKAKDYWNAEIRLLAVYELDNAITVMQTSFGKKGVAVCNPTDVYNTHIGMAIALARYRRHKIPWYFLEAPQPSELVKGHVVVRYNEFGEYLGEKVVESVMSVNGIGKNTHMINNKHGYAAAHGDRIVNDTDAVYVPLAMQDPLKVSDTDEPDKRDSLDAAIYAYGKFPTTAHNVTEPQHYHRGNIDVIKFAEENFPKEDLRGFFRINVLKYVTRYDEKGGQDDLDKAQFYLDKLKELEG